MNLELLWHPAKQVLPCLYKFPKVVSFHRQMMPTDPRLHIHVLPILFLYFNNFFDISYILPETHSEMQYARND